MLASVKKPWQSEGVSCEVEREENSLVSSRLGIMIVKGAQVPSQMGVGSCSVFKWP